MALVLDPASLSDALSPDDPCGPDLEAEGDLDFLNGLAHAESLLPAAFFTRDDEGRQLPFDRSTIDFTRETRALLALIGRTRDLRLLALLGRLAMLDRNLPAFSAALAAIATLLDERWDAVHPLGEAGDFTLRTAVLQSLDDVPTVLLPLQHVVLAQSRRYGPVTFRSVMAANGEVPPPADGSTPDRGAIDRAVADAEPDLPLAQLAALSGIAAAAQTIFAVTVAKAGYDQAINLERLKALSGRIGDFLGAIVQGAPAPSPAAAESAPGADATSTLAAAAPAMRPPGALASLADASDALAAAGRYLRALEPSSPAEILVRQAQMLVGKSFLEVMRILVPAYASEATIAIGANRTLRLTFDQLSAVPDDTSPDDPEMPSEEPAEISPDTGPDVDRPAAQPRKAASRTEAMALIREAAAFFRSHEPSSPIPLLLDKAAGMADRDFLAILKDVLPDLNAT